MGDSSPTVQHDGQRDGLDLIHARQFRRRHSNDGRRDAVGLRIRARRVPRTCRDPHHVKVCLGVAAQRITQASPHRQRRATELAGRTEGDQNLRATRGGLAERDGVASEGRGPDSRYPLSGVRKRLHSSHLRLCAAQRAHFGTEDGDQRDYADGQQLRECGDRPSTYRIHNASVKSRATQSRSRSARRANVHARIRCALVAGAVYDQRHMRELTTISEANQSGPRSRFNACYAVAHTAMPCIAWSHTDEC